MSTSYPECPDLPHDTWWPMSMTNLSLGNCPICGAEWITYRDLCETSRYHMRSEELPVLDFPHLRYECGGVWREIDGVWVGKCWAKKTKQLALQLTEETE